jgi:hypothetical protein
MESSVLPEQDALSNREAADRRLSLPGSSAQFVATNQVPDAMNWVLGSGAPTSSVISLLEHGLNCIRQGHYTEGLIFFAQAREQLLPDQMQLAAMLATLMQECEKHWQAQQALHQASKRFAEIDAELQAQIAIIEKVLPTFMQERDTDSTLQAIPQSLKNSNHHQMMQSSLSSVETVYLQRPPNKRLHLETKAAILFLHFILPASASSR